MIIVAIVFHTDTRLMEVVQSTTGKEDLLVATKGDDNSLILFVMYDDPMGILVDSAIPFKARMEYGVKMVNENHEVYFPYTDLMNEEETLEYFADLLGQNNELDTIKKKRGMEDYAFGGIAVVPSSVLLQAVNKTLPVQLRFSYTNTESGKSLDFYSLNILKFKVGYAVGAMGPAPPRGQTLNDAVVGVTYDPSTATFTYTQYNGDTIEIRLSDLSEEHFEVPTYDDLTILSEAQNGDTATALDTGLWYKLYGSYDNLDDWYMMSSGIGVANISYSQSNRRLTVTYSDGSTEVIDLSQNVTFNGSRTKVSRDLEFYAPTGSGNEGDFLISQGSNTSPTWVTNDRVLEMLNMTVSDRFTLEETDTLEESE